MLPFAAHWGAKPNSPLLPPNKSRQRAGPHWRAYLRYSRRHSSCQYLRIPHNYNRIHSRRPWSASVQERIRAGHWRGLSGSRKSARRLRGHRRFRTAIGGDAHWWGAVWRAVDPFDTPPPWAFHFLVRKALQTGVSSLRCCLRQPCALTSLSM